MDATIANSLPTSNGLYYISFIGSRHNHVFTAKPETLGNLIKAHGQYGIEEIRQFDEAKNKFNKMNKKDIASRFSWDTHSILQLQAKNFIKK